MKEKFLILGGLGHVGFNVVKKLVSMKKDVRVLINNKKHENKLPKNIEIFYGDVTKKDSLKDFFKTDKKDIVYVINCVNFYSSDESDNKKIYNVNVVGNKNVLECLKASNVDKYVYMSSHETTLSELTYYGECKKEAMEETEKNNNTLNISVVIPSIVIGPYDYRSNVANTYLYNIYLGNLKSFVKTNMHLIDVRDLADTLISTSLYGKNKKRYYVTGESISSEYLLKEFTKMCNSKKIRKLYTIDKLIKKENIMNKYCELKKIKPYYNQNLLKSFSEINFDITSSVTDLEFKSRNILETLNDTKLFFDTIKSK